MEVGKGRGRGASKRQVPAVGSWKCIEDAILSSAQSVCGTVGDEATGAARGLKPT